MPALSLSLYLALNVDITLQTEAAIFAAIRERPGNSRHWCCHCWATNPTWVAAYLHSFCQVRKQTHPNCYFISNYKLDFNYLHPNAFLTGSPVNIKHQCTLLVKRKGYRIKLLGFDSRLCHFGQQVTQVL